MADTQPRYFQVKLALADLIAELDRGMSLPPERQLAEQLGTSRTTLRKALAELAGEGCCGVPRAAGTTSHRPRWCTYGSCRRSPTT